MTINRSSGTRLARTGFVKAIVWGYPMLTVGTLYLTWLASWVTLGHMPRPSLDDPGQIGSVVDVIYVIAGVVLMGAPAAAVAGILLQLLVPAGDRLQRVRAAGLLALVWLITLALLRWDPLEVGAWFLD